MNTDQSMRNVHYLKSQRFTDADLLEEAKIEISKR